MLRGEAGMRWSAADAVVLVKEGKPIGEWSAEGWGLDPPAAPAS